MKNILITIVVTLLTLTVWQFFKEAETTTATPGNTAEPAFKRVMASGKIRCGYATWPPYIIKDPNTGALSGINVDTMERLGRELNLDIEWTEEVAWGNIAAALNTGRIDVMCATVWGDGDRVKQYTLTKPQFYSALYAFVRADDTRFDNGALPINSKGVKIAAIDGDSTYVAAALDAPNAEIYALPENAQFSDIPLSIATGKADITFVDVGMMADYMARNPGQIKRVEGLGPVRVFSENIAVKRGEYALRDMLDKATDILIYNGILEDIVRKYSDDYFVPQTPYQHAR